MPQHQLMYILDAEKRSLVSMQTPLNPDGLDLSMYSDELRRSVCREKLLTT